MATVQFSCLGFVLCIVRQNKNYLRQSHTHTHTHTHTPHTLAVWHTHTLTHPHTLAVWHTHTLTHIHIPHTLAVWHTHTLTLWHTHILWHTHTHPVTHIFADTIAPTVKNNIICLCIFLLLKIASTEGRLHIRVAEIRGIEIFSAMISSNGQLLAVADNLGIGWSITSFLICACLESRTTMVRKYQAVKVLWPTIESLHYLGQLLYCERWCYYHKPISDMTK